MRRGHSLATSTSRPDSDSRESSPTATVESRRPHFAQPTSESRTRRHRDAPQIRQGTPAAVNAPKSYRRLVDGIASSEAAARLYKGQALELSYRIAELRTACRQAMEHANRMRAEEAHSHAEIEHFRLESAAMWKAHEKPLEDQEEAVQTSARLVAALEMREESRSAVSSSLRLECEELQYLSSTLRCETEESAEAHVSFNEHMERAEINANSLAERCNEWDQRVEVLQSKVTSERDRGRLMVAEIEAARQQMDTAKLELSDRERQCQGSVMDWWQQQGTRCHSLHVESEMLQQELELGKKELDHHVEESAVCREQAYRSEAGLLQIRRGDVASGIRSLQEQCAVYANANAPYPP